MYRVLLPRKAAYGVQGDLLRLSDGNPAAFPLSRCSHVSTVRRGSNLEEMRTELSAARLVDVALSAFGVDTSTWRSQLARFDLRGDVAPKRVERAPLTCAFVEHRLKSGQNCGCQLLRTAFNGVRDHAPGTARSPIC
jgi:hypothetical protein